METLNQTDKHSTTLCSAFVFTFWNHLLQFVGCSASSLLPVNRPNDSHAPVHKNKAENNIFHFGAETSKVHTIRVVDHDEA